MAFTAIILAAGKGSRLKSNLPKPLHQVGGHPMLGWVIDSAKAAGADQIIPVISKDSPALEDYLSDFDVAIQDPPLGTGHAVLAAAPHIHDKSKPLILLFGDTPLISAASISKLAGTIEDGLDICVVGFETDTPTGYGRLVFDADNQLTGIVEDSEASDSQKQIKTVNGGMMAGRADVMLGLLETLSPDNSQGEIFLTDIVASGHAQGHKMNAIFIDRAEISGVNSRADLAHIEAVLQHKLRQAAMAEGATLQAPDTVFLSSDTILERDVVIEPHVVIGPGVHIGEGSIIKAFSHLEGVQTKACCVIGPYARLRPGTTLDEGVKIGNFVETKKARIAAGAKVNHLSYVGDADVGSKANIGAGTITCNYDGFNKHQTLIGDGAFIGSNTALVAPVSVGAGAIIGAGSTITKDVPEDGLGLTRAPQANTHNFASRLRTRLLAIKNKNKQS